MSEDKIRFEYRPALWDGNAFERIVKTLLAYCLEA